MTERGARGQLEDPSSSLEDRVRCATCGELASPFARFCASCGSRLGGARAPPRAAARANELRPLTIMFCDLVGSSTIAAEMDAEDFTEIIGGFFRGVSEAVGARGGYVGRMLGDGALIYFGFPSAQEDDAERAVVAALDIIARFSARPVCGCFLQVRIGLSTGLVLLGDVMGTGRPGSLDVYGETPNLAARLQAMAEPNTVLVSDSVRRLVGERFEFRDWGTRDVKGWWEPVSVLQVVREIEHVSRFEARRGRLANPLLGRDAVAERLHAIWRRARAGAGGGVLLRGEAGIGKSRLIAELLRHATDAQVIRLFCGPHQQGMVLQPAIQQLERAAGITLQDDGATRLEKLRAVLPGADPVDLALVAELLLIDAAERPVVAALTPARKRAQLIRALLDNIGRAAEGSPVLVVVEDAHWADPSTLELVSTGIGEIASAPVLLVVTARPELRPDWETHQSSEVIDLAPLSAEDSATLVRLVARDVPVPQQMVDDIARRAEGVPLYLEELTKSVIDALTQSRSFRSEPGSGGPRASVPVSISASILSRLDRLGPARGVAEVASVIGREFELDLLEPALAGTEASLADTLDRLVEAGIFQRAGTSGRAYRFRHALLQDATYGMITRDLRRVLHGRVASIVEALLPDSTAGRPQLLAHHWSEAGEPRRAVQWWLHGARLTLGQLAPAEALVQTGRGLAQLESLPEDEWRWRTEVELQLVAANALMVTHGHASLQTGAALARAVALCDRLPSSRLRMDARFASFSHLLLSGELVRALDLAESLLASGGEEVERFAGFRARGIVHFMLGRFFPSIDDLQRCISLWEGGQAGGGVALAHDPGVIGVRCYRSYSLTFAGRIAEARREAAAAVAGAHASGHHLIVAQAMYTPAILDFRIGATDAAKPVLEEALAYSREHGVAYFITQTAVRLAVIQGRDGDLAGGLGRLQEAIAFLRAANTYTFLPMYLRYEAELLLLAGRLPESFSRLAESLRVMENTAVRWDEPACRGLLARAMIADGRPEHGEAELRRAVAVAAEQGARLYQVEVASDLAPLLARTGRVAEGRDLLRRSLAFFAQEEPIPVTVRARDCLRRLDAEHAR